MSTEPINVIASKLDKDEMYSFISGFGTGLLYFISFALYIERPANDPTVLVSRIPSTFNSILLIIVISLLFIAFTYGIYQLLYLWLNKMAEKPKVDNKPYVLNLTTIQKFVTAHIHLLILVAIHFFWLLTLLAVGRFTCYKKVFLLGNMSLGYTILIMAILCLCIGLILWFLPKNITKFNNFNEILNKGKSYIGANDTMWAEVFNRRMEEKKNPNPSNKKSPKSPASLDHPFSTAPQSE